MVFGNVPQLVEDLDEIAVTGDQYVTRYGLGFPNTWWVDPAKDAKVNAYRRTKKTSES